jgi:hypothetical protein
MGAFNHEARSGWLTWVKPLRRSAGGLRLPGRVKRASHWTQALWRPRARFWKGSEMLRRWLDLLATTALLLLALAAAYALFVRMI